MKFLPVFVSAILGCVLLHTQISVAAENEVIGISYYWNKE